MGLNAIMTSWKKFKAKTPPKTTNATRNIGLVESATTKGLYTGTAHFTPAIGEVYAVYIYDENGVQLAITEDIYGSPYDKSVLNIINDVQSELRFTNLSVDVTDSHGALLLALMNRVIRDYIPEGYVWDAIKVSGSLFTVTDLRLYPIAPVNTNEIETVRSMKIGTSEPIKALSDDKFRLAQRQYTTPGQPLFRRIYGRAGGVLFVEFAPTPDKAYQVDYEVLQRPSRLVNSTDVPMLDPDILLAGTLMLAKAESGRDYSAESAAFGLKLSMEGETQSDSNWQDMEPV